MASRSTLSRAFGRNAPLLVVIALILLLVLIGGVMTDRFLTTRNLVNIFEQSTGLGLVSLGQTLVILTGGIDLSLGSVMSLAATLSSGIINKDPALMITVLPMVIVLATAIGALNGALIDRLGVHPLIVTLGTGTVVQGMILLYAMTPIGAMPVEMGVLSYGRFLGLPIGASLMVLAFILAALWLRYTGTGRDVYAFGDDPAAARLLGINRLKLLMIVYGMCGFFAAIAGIYVAVRLGVGSPYLGQNYTLASITPVVVGGTMLSGGRGGVIGSLLGVFLVSVLNNLLNFMQVSTHIQLVAQALIIIAAVSVYLDAKRRMA
ncbi:MAG: ABC transporter permease [Cypionkella sp.]|uniref:ABC transporter permease n=1 Tax=Cypionkella sp. TaxID=2811411 RepID=UPI0027265B5E|nr:ABC transporter permease [Cypionkella sp.]MDO8327589.1 ABC transporter permease [Cypionkella sp.]